MLALTLASPSACPMILHSKGRITYRPSLSEGALSPLVFLPATFPVRVLPGDKLFQSRVVREDCTLAPVTHAFGGSKLRVGDMLKKAGGPPLPLVAAMRGVENKLPLWACDDGCDFIRGTGPCNQ